MFNWVLEKIGWQTAVFIGGAALILSLWGGVKYYKYRAEQARAKQVVAEKTLEVKEDQREREKKVDKMGDDDIRRYWGADGVPSRPGSGPTPTPSPARP